MAEKAVLPWKLFPPPDLTFQGVSGTLNQQLHFSRQMTRLSNQSWGTRKAASVLLHLREVWEEKSVAAAFLPSLYTHFWGQLCAGWAAAWTRHPSHFCLQEAEASVCCLQTPCPSSLRPAVPAAARVSTLVAECPLSQMRCLPAKRDCICSS